MRYFNQDHVYDGVRFEYLMNYIFKGLNQTEAGSAQIAAWVNDLSPANIEKNLVWRTFAFNQKKAFGELYTLLKRIKVARAAESVITPLLKIKTIEKEKKVVEYLAATQNYFDSSKAVTDIYKGVTDARVNLFVDKLKASDYSDHFLAAITRPLVSSFSSTAVNLGMSDSLLAGRVLMRSGASPFAINELMSKVRANLPLLRPVSPSPIGFNRLQRPSTIIFADALAQAQARATLTEAYKNFKISNIKGSSAGLGTFLGGGIVFMEVINFYKLSFDAASKKDSKSYSQLFASGLAVVGGLAATYAFRVDALNQNTSVNYGKLKAFAGVTLGIAGYIGAFWDFEERQARKRKGYNGVALAYTIKVVMGTANATGVAITGFQTGEVILKSMASGAVGQGALRVGAVAMEEYF